MGCTTARKRSLWQQLTETSVWHAHLRVPAPVPASVDHARAHAHPPRAATTPFSPHARGCAGVRGCWLCLGLMREIGKNDP